jgi:NAD(P)-dependent dehydrogenase (short-subunit alcohol dehydrogenase family)
MRFENRTVIVTGGASGIGLATCKRFASEGAHVVIADLKLESAQIAASELGNDALAVQCDVSKEGAVIECVRLALERFGRLDVIVNNAGLMVFKPIEELTTEDWIRILSVDLLGAFYFTKQAFLQMKNGGAIVNVSSVHAKQTDPLVAPYAAAKAAMLSLTRTTQLEGKSKGIRCNAILPGAVDTPMLWNNPNVKSGAEKIAAGDVGKPEDIAATIAFLASDDAAFVEGADLLVDGGRLSDL